jgi:hypothetical protein
MKYGHQALNILYLAIRGIPIAQQRLLEADRVDRTEGNRGRLMRAPQPAIPLGCGLSENAVRMRLLCIDLEKLAN